MSEPTEEARQAVRQAEAEYTEAGHQWAEALGREAPEVVDALRARMETADIRRAEVADSCPGAWWEMEAGVPDSTPPYGVLEAEA